MLLPHKVDAVAVFAPFITKALSRPGSKVLFTAGDLSGTISDHLVFNRKFVNEHPDVSKIFDDRFVNAYAAKTK
jgi:NitT/TauT family transport system substrate-binding protein